MNKLAGLVIAIGAPGTIGAVAAAELLGNTTGFPMLFFNLQDELSYDAQSDLLSVLAYPSAMRFACGTTPRFVTPAGKEPDHVFTIDIVVDEDGCLVGGVDGHDLLVGGQVDADGDGVVDFGTPLLTGEVVAFGYLNIGGDASNAFGLLNTDVYDFEFTLTGGSLAPLYATDLIAVVLASENSSFLGSFTVDFGGEAKGPVGPSSCLGDTDSDGVVGVDDLVRVVLDWGLDACASDFDDDGTVDVDDLITLVESWGPCG